MSQELVQYQMSDIEKMAVAVAESGLFGIKTKQQAMALMLIAQAEGRHPVEAARDYNIIQGRPAKNADAMLRDFLSSGGKVEWHTLTNEKADATFSHPNGGTLRIDWDMDRAKKAGLGGKEMWSKYPRQMLRSRVISEGVRSVCPAATSGMSVPEEVKDFYDQTMKNVTPEAVNEIFESVEKRKEEISEDELVKDIETRAQAAAEKGGDSLSAFWKTLSADEKRRMIPFGTKFRKIANEVDKKNEGAPINDELPENLAGEDDA